MQKQQLEAIQSTQMMILQQLKPVSISVSPAQPLQQEVVPEVVPQAAPITSTASIAPPAQIAPTGPIAQIEATAPIAPLVMPTLEGVNDGNSMPLSAIEKTKLRSQEQILSNQPPTNASNAGKLAVKLARECVFGEDIMRQCTPFGAGKLPGLPVRELQWLKQLMLERFPEFWGDAP